MWATVLDLGDHVEVEVEFEVGDADGASLTLCPERDRLAINGVEAEQIRALGHVFYVAEFAGAAEPSYEIALTRDDAEDVSVVVEMPPSLEILAPAASSSHSRSEALEISWDPPWPGQLLELAVEDAVGSDCLEAFGVAYQVDDIGSYLLDDPKLASEEQGVSCEVTLALSRGAIVDYPAALHEGGEIAAFVRRRQPFTSTP